MITESISECPGGTFFPLAEQTGAQVDDLGTLCLEQFGLGHNIVSRTVTGHDPGEGGFTVPCKALFFLLQAGKTTCQRAFVEVFVTTD
jgi:hypothetical protein